MKGYWRFWMMVFVFVAIICCNVDTTLGQPSIKLFGSDTIRLERCHGFIDPGYAASSTTYGDLTSKVVVTSNFPFDSVILNTYIFKYSLTDPGNNVATPQYRVVIVSKDTTPPVLVVAGPDTILKAVTNVPTYPPPIQSVISVFDACGVGNVVNNGSLVESNILGFYKVTYSATDYSGNTTTVYRWVHIIDTIKPIITLFGPSHDTIEVGDRYLDPGVFIRDNYDPVSSLNKNLVITNLVDSSKVGTYTVTYNDTDQSGNKAKPVVRIVVVVDSIPPNIALNGRQLDSVEGCVAYIDLGVKVSDNYDSVSAIKITISGTFYSNFPTGIASRLGTYSIIYTATDKSDNKSVVTRIVRVTEISPPTITLKGSLLVSICRWAAYQDSGYIVTNPCSDSTGITVDTFGTFITNGGTSNPGTYFLRYKATNKTGNSSYSDTRTIFVIPNDEGNCVSGIGQTSGLNQFISIFPNPGNGVFFLDNLFPNKKEIQISITNVLGQQIYMDQTILPAQGRISIDLNRQVSGIYIANITSDGEQTTKKIVIER